MRETLARKSIFSFANISSRTNSPRAEGIRARGARNHRSLRSLGLDEMSHPNREIAMIDGYALLWREFLLLLENSFATIYWRKRKWTFWPASLSFREELLCPAHLPLMSA